MERCADVNLLSLSTHPSLHTSPRFHIPHTSSLTTHCSLLTTHHSPLRPPLQDEFKAGIATMLAVKADDITISASAGSVVVDVAVIVVDADVARYLVCKRIPSLEHRRDVAMPLS